MSKKQYTEVKNAGPKAPKGAAVTWGSAEYLKEFYDDIDVVRELSRKCVDLKEAKRIVGAVSNAKNGLYVYKAYKCSGKADGQLVESVIVHVVVGTNGAKGVQRDYMLALAKLVSSGFRVIDCHVDAVDDLADLLCTFERAKK